MFKPNSKIVFFGAHTDDEMVCAGTLHRLVREGHSVSVITFATAATEADRRGYDQSYGITQLEWDKALGVIGADKDTSRLYNFIVPSADFHPHRQKIADVVFNYCEGNKPDVAFILSPDDENPAHSVCGIECERVMRGRVPTVIRCPFPWNYTLGRPNLFVRLNPTDLEAKCRVIQAYRSQHFRYAYEAMFVSYAKADGLSVKVGAAEKFEVIRSVV